QLLDGVEPHPGQILAAKLRGAGAVGQEDRVDDPSLGDPGQLDEAPDLEYRGGIRVLDLPRGLVIAGIAQVRVEVEETSLICAHDRVPRLPQLRGRRSTPVSGGLAQVVAPVGAELDADPSTEGVGGLGDCVQPGALAASAHDEQVPMADLETEARAAPL